MAKFKQYKHTYQHIQVPFRGQYEKQFCDKRREWVQNMTGTSLGFLGQWPATTAELEGQVCGDQMRGNIENLIGFAKVPVGIAGPLSIKGDHVTGEVLCPMATTEGALVASVMRGTVALNRCGGVRARVIKHRISRMPVITTDNMDQANALSNWLMLHTEQMQDIAKGTSNHVRLKKVSPTPMGRSLHVSFVYETGDASGQNGVTKATWQILKWIQQKVKEELPYINTQRIVIESGGSCDKKVSSGNHILGRGTEVQTEVYIPEYVLQEVLKVDLDCLYSCYAHFLQGCQRSGVHGFNINTANLLASVYTAAGQDIASLQDCASAFFQLLPIDNINKISHQTGNSSDKGEKYGERGLYACLVLPSLVIGTVGGGTHLPTQKECLQIIDCLGKGKKYRLAEILGSFALALELSTLAALAAGHFADAHEKLGRNKPA